ncbi:MAG: hypothetical protein EPO13_05920 [Actinomycetota bacterium]|nr:MAG: hypothetical protein EPO13_05920 [Actinomycetota bacterium]
MKVRSAEEVADAVDNSLAWRRMEMKTLEKEVQRAAQLGEDKPVCRALTRSSLAVLYAHWEGFVRDAFGAYVDYISASKPKFAELNDGLLRAVAKALHRRVANGDLAALQSVAEAVRRPSEGRAPIPSRAAMVDTRANLRFEVLKEILGSVGMDSAEFETKQLLIDKSLCDARNSIAHGRYLDQGSGQYLELQKEVLHMMEELRDKIVFCASSASYRIRVPDSVEGADVLSGST